MVAMGALFYTYVKLRDLLNCTSETLSLYVLADNEILA